MKSINCLMVSHSGLILFFLTVALSCPTPIVPENSIMKGDNFTYGSKVIFRYHLHPPASVDDEKIPFNFWI